MDVYNWFVIFGMVQLVHSQEEIWAGFHNKWFAAKLPLWLFVSFEIVLSVTIISYIINPNFAGADIFMPWFIFVMLLNGMEHIIWAAVKKSYVPGLITAPIFIILFALYYAWLIG
jgi:hypothetical protein